MSIWQCAVGADREVKSSLDTLCLSEADTWSKLSYAMMSQHSLQTAKSVTAVEEAGIQKLQALAQDAERKNNLVIMISQQLNQSKEQNAELMQRIQALTKQLEISEAHNVTLTKEKAGITKELVVAQNTIRKLYKESQSKKTHCQVKWTNDNRPGVGGSLLVPAGLWGTEDTRIKVKDPVLPKIVPVCIPETPENPALQAEQPVPCVSDTGGVQTSTEVVMDREGAAPRKRADRKGSATKPPAGRTTRKAAAAVERAAPKEKAANSGDEKRRKRLRQRG